MENICTKCNGERTVKHSEHIRFMCERCHGFGTLENKTKYHQRFTKLLRSAIRKISRDETLRKLSDHWMDFRCSEYPKQKDCDCFECSLVSRAIEAALKVLEREDLGGLQ